MSMHKSNVPVDGGFSWVVCAAVAVIFSIGVGVPKSLGVMLLEFQNHFQSDPSITSLTVALVLAGFFMFVFFSNTLGLLFDNRTVTACGSVLAFLSILLTSFAPNIYFVVVFLGLLSGMAYSAMFGPPLVVLSTYFVKRRALANGLAVAGGSFGQLVIPFLFNFFVQHYGFRGGMIVFSSVVLHAVPACILLRPTSFYNRRIKTLEDHSTGACSEPPKGCWKRFASALKMMLDKELLSSSLFYHMTTSIILAHLGYFCSLMFMPLCANEFFNDRMISVTVAAVIGISDLFGRVLGGYLADLKLLKIYDLMGVSLAIPGVVTVLAAMFPAVWLMFLNAICIGLFAGSYTALLTPIIVELFGPTKVAPGFGILTFLMGFFMGPFPTLLAFAYKATLTYKTVLLITGSLMVLSGCSFCLMHLTVWHQHRSSMETKKTGVGRESQLANGGCFQTNHNEESHCYA